MGEGFKFLGRCVGLVGALAFALGMAALLALFLDFRRSGWTDAMTSRLWYVGGFLCAGGSFLLLGLKAARPARSTRPAGAPAPAGPTGPAGAPKPAQNRPGPGSTAPGPVAPDRPASYKGRTVEFAACPDCGARSLVVRRHRAEAASTVLTGECLGCGRWLVLRGEGLDWSVKPASPQVEAPPKPPPKPARAPDLPQCFQPIAPALPGRELCRIVLSTPLVSFVSNCLLACVKLLDEETALHLVEFPSGRHVATLHGAPPAPEPPWRAWCWGPGAAMIAEIKRTSVQLWTFRQGAVCRGPELSFGSPGCRVRDAALSPDGRYLATLSDDNLIYTYHLDNGEQTSFPAGQKYQYLTMAPDGRSLAAHWIRKGHSSSDNERVSMFTFPEGKRLRELKLSPDDELVFSRDGRYIARRQGTEVTLHDAGTGGEVGRIRVPIQGRIGPVFHPIRPLLGAGRWIYEVPSLRTVASLAGAILDWSPDGEKLALALDEQVCIQEFVPPEGANPPDGLASSPADGASEWREVASWGVPAPEGCVPSIGSVTASPCGRWLAALCHEELGVFELRTGERVHGLGKLKKGWCGFSSRGHLYVYDPANQTLWSIEPSSGRRTAVWQGIDPKVCSTRLSPSGRFAAFVTLSRQVALVDVEDRREVQRFQAFDLDFFPDERRMAVVDSSKDRVLIRDITSREVLRTLKGEWEVSCVAVSPDGWLAMGDSVIALWAVGAESASRICTHHTHSLRFSPDGRWLATRGYDGGRVFEVASGREVWRSPTRIDGIAFTSDSHLITGAGDRVTLYRSSADTGGRSPGDA
ncbi:MAG: hypothetical protein HY319_08135 [Armatimonadetes bacterium]|nr:hypothetical protein [Armatimonadota bacterium]